MRIIGLIGAIITTIAGILFASISLGSYYFNGTSLQLIEASEWFYKSGMTLLVIFAVIAYIGHILTYIASFKHANSKIKTGSVLLILYTVYRVILIFIPLEDTSGLVGIIFVFFVPVVCMALGMLLYFIGCFKIRYFVKLPILTWIITAFLWVLAADLIDMIFNITSFMDIDSGILYWLWRDNFYLLGLLPTAWVIAFAKNEYSAKRSKNKGSYQVNNTGSNYQSELIGEDSKSRKSPKKRKDEEVSFEF